MDPKRIVILPGLDGYDLLLESFTGLAPSGHSVSVMTLPDDPSDDYESLSRSIAARLREFAPCHLIAESFSGPLGIKLAFRHPELVERLTLVASFADSPAPWFARWLPWSLLFRFPLPLFAAKLWFVGAESGLASLLRTAIRQTSVATLRKRLNCVFKVDVCVELKKLSCPIQYLRPTHDRLIPARAVRRIATTKETVVIKEIDAPHLILQTRPKQAWAAISDHDA